jgi:hypothetical protein
MLAHDNHKNSCEWLFIHKYVFTIFQIDSMHSREALYLHLKRNKHC